MSLIHSQIYSHIKDLNIYAPLWITCMTPYAYEECLGLSLKIFGVLQILFLKLLWVKIAHPTYSKDGLARWRTQKTLGSTAFILLSRVKSRISQLVIQNLLFFTPKWSIVSWEWVADIKWITTWTVRSKDTEKHY